MVHDESSPWIGYLVAVYRERPPLPFSLANLTFFYHHDRYWPADVEWPMATCPCKDTGPSQNGCVADTNTTIQSYSCAADECQRWRGDRNPARSALHVWQRTRGYSQARFEVALLANDVGTSRGAIMTLHGHGAKPTDGRAKKNDRDLPKGHTNPGSWVEVIRYHSRMGEGVDNYGCWFGAGAIGSGIWLHTGLTRTECIWHSHSLHNKGEYSPSHYEWKEAMTRGKLGSTFNVTAANEARWRLLGPLGHSASLPQSLQAAKPDLFHYNYSRESQPYYAAALGLDSLKCITAWNGLDELVMLNAHCMNGTHPLLGCAPAGLDLRSGWAHDKTCICDEPPIERVTSLKQIPPQNCRGVARSDVWPGVSGESRLDW